MKGERKTLVSFLAAWTHAYPLDEAVADEAVVPLLYEGRMVAQQIRCQRHGDKWFEKISQGLTDQQKADLKRKFSASAHCQKRNTGHSHQSIRDLRTLQNALAGLHPSRRN